jgi:hypothetical protein
MASKLIWELAHVSLIGQSHQAHLALLAKHWLQRSTAMRSADSTGRSPVPALVVLPTPYPYALDMTPQARILLSV